MRKISGLFFVFFAILGVWIFQTDIEKQKPFKDNGVEVQATITGLQMMFIASKSSRPPSSFPVAFDYEYTVSNVHYQGHAKLNPAQAIHAIPHKGDIISIVYLANDPKTSRSMQELVDVSDIELLKKALIVIGALGLVMFILPDKKTA
jgi:hypothetical protein